MEKRNWLEIVVTALSIALVTGIFGILIYQMAMQEATPPDIVVTVGQPAPSSQHYKISVEVRNNGTTTAKNVEIEVGSTGAKDEKSILKFDYIPGKSTVTGWAVFRTQPDFSTIETKVLGFIEP